MTVLGFCSPLPTGPCAEGFVLLAKEWGDQQRLDVHLAPLCHLTQTVGEEPAQKVWLPREGHVPCASLSHTTRAGVSTAAPLQLVVPRTPSGQRRNTTGKRLPARMGSHRGLSLLTESWADLEAANVWLLEDDTLLLEISGSERRDLAGV